MALPPLIDPKTGIATITLVPYHLTRLHGPEPEPPPVPGLSPPLLEGAEPFEVELRAGMHPEEIDSRCEFRSWGSLDRRSWWSWNAHAHFEFGWSSYPFIHFMSNRLYFLRLERFGPGENQNYDALTEYMQSLLGPGESGVRPKGCWPFTIHDPLARRYTKWQFEWGEVRTGFEGMEGDASLCITWIV